MHPFVPRRHSKDGPEAKIQERIVKELKNLDWYVKVMIGNMYQFGVPDLYAAHLKYGQRWIEVKNPLSFSFTKAQQEEFPKLHAAGVGVWILFDSTPEELLKLTKPANWLEVYLKWVNNAHK